MYQCAFRLNVPRTMTAVLISSVANSVISVSNALMGLVVLMMTSAVAKKFANLASVQVNQVRKC